MRPGPGISDCRAREKKLTQGTETRSEGTEDMMAGCVWEQSA